jgi:hypothetical protein
MFKRTVGVSCSLKESIDGLEIIICGNICNCLYYVVTLYYIYCQIYYFSSYVHSVMSWMYILFKKWPLVTLVYVSECFQINLEILKMSNILWSMCICKRTFFPVCRMSGYVNTLVYFYLAPYSRQERVGHFPGVSRTFWEGYVRPDQSVL